LSGRPEFERSGSITSVFMRFLPSAKPGSDESTATVVCNRRIVVRDGSIEGVALLQQQSSSTTRAWVSESILRVCAAAFKWNKKCHSISFESKSRLMRIESNAFSYSSLQSIVIPNSVEILGSFCFSRCKSLSSISFESNSRLMRIESHAFSGLSL
jgi:hypothetical protein